MKILQITIIEWFLRLSLSAGFLSAVADRLGFWPKEVSVWGDWENFLEYTKTLNPFIPVEMIPAIGFVATFLEVVFAVLLLTNFKTQLIARGSGVLLLLFGLSMAFSTGLKAPLDYSVFCASAAAFSLSQFVLIEKK
ncbi:DoxX family protein [Flavobacterium ajazii]|uniref:DoxX family protein n=1 Tax=Flavobacterium ajazii TaxID=2692318 RepID=UPI0013D2D295|nr:DoxX family protein [Flavobacterium ajazii]